MLEGERIGTMYLWQRDFSRSFIDKYISLLIDAYKSIDASSRKEVLLEEQRRKELVEKMRELKSNYQIMFPISYEVGEGTKRMDIVCYLDYLSEEYYICFECKRFIQKGIIASYFKNEYYGEGIKRYEDAKYSSKMNCTGMAAFLESGSYEKLMCLFQDQLPLFSVNQPVEENRSFSGQDYCVFRSLHHRVNELEDIEISHVLLNLTCD